MKKKINPKVMNMIDSVEKKEVALKNMMKTVIRDKKKIEETIVTLDEYKKKALHETWTKVNGDFGQIFAELLPGSFAKLDPPEGKTINEGLEVKVSLGLFSSFESYDDITNTKNRQSVEAESYGAIRRTAFSYCDLPHHGSLTVQTCANVYPRRG
jgi:hypothetical protein